ncbi:unnamed protein product [Schistocephalus solidus]|uniref:BAH domain-containing protein n=1 Tax=Schistocephalus solidus TaxID=70667 RepID=A0A183T2W9_SCHSO|nr:unnamed protein product [Schistocephalus solidus]
MEVRDEKIKSSSFKQYRIYDIVKGQSRESVKAKCQEEQRREKTQVASAAGVTPGHATTNTSDPTERECHKGHIKKEPLQPDSQFASQPLHSCRSATFHATAFSAPSYFQARQIVYSDENALNLRPHSLYHPHHQAIIRAGQLADAEMGAAAGDLVYTYDVHDLAHQTQATGFYTRGG